MIRMIRMIRMTRAEASMPGSPSHTDHTDHTDNLLGIEASAPAKPKLGPVGRASTERRLGGPVSNLNGLGGGPPYRNL